MARVLVTGFEPFADDGYNPSGAVVRRLGAGGGWGDDVAALVLPVTWAGAVRVLLARADREAAAGCVMFGLAAGSAGLRVERAAYNLADAVIADNARTARAGGPLVDGGPARVETGVATEAVLARLRASGVPAEPSEDPGRFVCNALYYGVLTAGRAYSRRSLFVHVPATRVLGGVLEEDEVARWMQAAVAAWRDVSGC